MLSMVAVTMLCACCATSLNASPKGSLLREVGGPALVGFSMWTCQTARLHLYTVNMFFCLRQQPLGR